MHCQGAWPFDDNVSMLSGWEISDKKKAPAQSRGLHIRGVREN